MRIIGLAAILCMTVLAPGTSPAHAAPFPPDFRTLGLGIAAADLPTEGYEAFACGSNGGPPLQRLRGWTDYMRCAPDSHGLREVYVEFGTELGRLSELFREQYQQEPWFQRYGGTRIANFPVVLSLLFDQDGITRGFRAVTDSRAGTDERGRSYLLRFRIYPLYGSDGWNCVDRQPAPGETGVGNTYLNQLCTKVVDGKWVRVEGQFFRRPGQTGVDINGDYVPGQYQAMTRWEAFDAAVVQPE